MLWVILWLSTVIYFILTALPKIEVQLVNKGKATNRDLLGKTRGRVGIVLGFSVVSLVLWWIFLPVLIFREDKFIEGYIKDISK